MVVKISPPLAAALFLPPAGISSPRPIRPPTSPRIFPPATNRTMGVPTPPITRGSFKCPAPPATTKTGEKNKTGARAGTLLSRHRLLRSPKRQRFHKPPGPRGPIRTASPAPPTQIPPQPSSHACLLINAPSIP